MEGQLLKEMGLPSFDGAIEIEVDQLPSVLVVLDWQAAEGRAVNRVMISN